MSEEWLTALLITAATVLGAVLELTLGLRRCGCPRWSAHVCAAAADGRLDEQHEGRRTTPIVALPPVVHDPDAELPDLVDDSPTVELPAVVDDGPVVLDAAGLDRLWAAVAAADPVSDLSEEQITDRFRLIIAGLAVREVDGD